MKAKSTSSEARFAYEGLDRVIHERARLSILTSLITNPKGLTFVDLKQLCALTDGNLSRHLTVLETAKMVVIAKGHDRNRPQTLCKITASGRGSTRYAPCRRPPRACRGRPSERWRRTRWRPRRRLFPWDFIRRAITD